MLKLGYGFWNLPDQNQAETALANFLELDNSAIELSFFPLTNLQQGLSQKALNLIKQFTYISLHMPAAIFVDPVTQEKPPIHYPSKAGEQAASLIKQLKQQLNIQTVLVHPDIVDDFDWLNKQFGNQLAFENMDNRKKFGKSIADLEYVFSKSPQAKFVLDVNHVYTNDQTMELATQMHQHFKDRLCHYHLSAYNGFHDVFISNQNESIILQGVQDLNKPIIHEGDLINKSQTILIKEDQYLKQSFNSR